MIGFSKLGNLKKLNMRKINYWCYLCQNSFNINTSHIVKFYPFIVEKRYFTLFASISHKKMVKFEDKIYS